VGVLDGRSTLKIPYIPVFMRNQVNPQALRVDAVSLSVLQSHTVKKPFPIVLIRGGGDLASGVALRLFHCGLKIVITELAQPLAVRRLVSFGEAVYRGSITVEQVTARLVSSWEDVVPTIQENTIPVLIDPHGEIIHHSAFRILALVDARMTKRPPDFGLDAASFVIGLGPGFIVGENCHAAIETNRGHYLGRVLWQGAPQADTGFPEKVTHHQADRVLRAPADGTLLIQVQIGESIQAGQLIASVAGQSVLAPFDGVLRGLLHEDLGVTRGLKIGDLDPRNDPRFATLVSEKSLAIGGGVLEAILSQPEIRTQLWT
jgi:xanthine dehydrogenase accessory factor